MRRGLGIDRQVDADFGTLSVPNASRIFASVDHARYGAPPGEPLAVWSYRAISAALSDMACCGAEKVYAQIDLQVPRSGNSTDVEQVGHGVRTALEVYGCVLLNGNNLTLNHDGPFKLTTAVHGTSPHDRVEPPGRNGARRGHLVGCSRIPGRFNAALRQLNSRDPAPIHDAGALLGGSAELAVGRALVSCGAASAILDLNDALLLGAADLAHASGVEIHLARDTLTGPEAAGLSLHDILTPPSGDLALLFTAAREHWENACGAIDGAGGRAVQVGVCAAGAPRVALTGYTDEQLHALTATVWRPTAQFVYPATAVLSSLSEATPQ
ncbi:Thiamine-monophosphate kinase [Mycobacterium lentiflavum]|uniref:Thiamine-monophosphate kinase n=1 Tax=Mycobacterium lentiflavum TaxID=141349 RepID=A0A0E4H2M7_MYCLN|nr:AIR synthase related protein [Mycobacterium lentiflavum]CQD22889.1 Thiamine-monophosphate kinase [Mycobacterium lentiflavum]